MASMWQRLTKPVWCLAPMEGVSDTVLRQMIVATGAPDVFFTEFTSVDGLNSQGFEYVAERLKYTEVERPLVAQIWGLEPENFYIGAKLLVKLKFDGIDINMGCPDRAVVKMGAGSALIKNRELAGKMIRATKAGAGGKVPVSVKIRTGFDKPVTEEWSEFILSQGIEALTVHGRTTKQLSKAAADWGEIEKAVKVRDRLKVKTLVIGNGDVMSLKEARGKVDKYGVDGVMFGRGVLRDPWLFNEKKSKKTATKQEKLELLVKQVRLFEETWGEKKPFNITKKFVKVYVDGFRGARTLRAELMEVGSRHEMEEVIGRY